MSNLFSRFWDYIRASDDDDEVEDGIVENHSDDNGTTNNASNTSNNTNSNSNPSMDSNSSSSSEMNTSDNKKRRVKEDYRIKYGYLDYVNYIDMRGLDCLSEDVRSNVEILKNSYLAIVNSLVILNERRRKRRQLQMTGSQLSKQDSTVQSNSSNFINSKVANNFRNSDQDYLSTYSDTYEWTIEKFCDPATRDSEFEHLFRESENYIQTVDRIKSHREAINMAKFSSLVRQGKNLLGIIELLNNNYSNNFLDIFRLS